MKCEHVGKIFLIVLLPYHGTHYAVAYKYDKHLDQRLETFGSLVLAFFVSLFGDHDNNDKQQHNYHDGCGHFGDGEIKRLDNIAGSVETGLPVLVDTYHFLLFDTSTDETIAFVVGMTMMELGGHENVEMTIINQYHRQGNGYGMFDTGLVEKVEHVPGMGIGDMADNSRARIETGIISFRCFFCCFFCCRRYRLLSKGLHSEKEGQEKQECEILLHCIRF